MKEQIKSRLVFISKGNAKFVRNDKEALSGHFRVVPFIYPDKAGIINIWFLFRVFLFCLWHIPKSEVVYLWFADYHTAIPTVLSKIFGKRSILIIGGYDAANRPDLSYGAHRNKYRSYCIDLSCRMALHVVVVSEFVRENLLRNTSGKFDTKLIYNAIPFREANGVDEQEKKYVCTVAPGDKLYRFKIKGLDVFLNAARQLPDIPFLIIGPKGELLNRILSENLANVTVESHLPHGDFLDRLETVRIICQFSRYEAFGVSLLEAMQLGALPMSSDHTGTSELVPEGDQYRVDLDQEKEIAGKIRTNYLNYSDPRQFAKHVNNNYNLDQRFEKILELIRSD